MKNVFANLVLILVISAISLLPFVWIKEGLIYMSEEDNFGNYQNVLYRNSHAWSQSFNKGNPVLSNDHITIIPAGIVYQFFSRQGISNDVIEKVYLSAIIFITLVSVCYALNIFTRDRSILLTGALFYFLNFYIKSTTYYSAKMYQLILIPLFFAFFYKFLQTRKYIYVGLNFLFFFVFQAIFTNLAAFITTFVFYLIALLYHFIQQEKHFISYIKNQAIQIIIFFLPLTSIFFYNGVIYYFSYVSNNIYDSIKSAHTFSAITAPINLILQIRGAWWETAGFEGVSYNPWLWFYNNPFIVLISFLLVLFLFSYCIYKRNVSRDYFFWIIVFLIGIMFTSGFSLYQPLYAWFFKNIPLFYVFREPWAKFMPMVLFASAIVLVLNLRDFKNKYIVVGVLAIILIRGIPFFSPDFFDYHSRRGYMPFARLPVYWKEYENWTLTHRNVDIVSIPINYFMRNWYSEDVGNINHPLFRLFGYSNIIYDLGNNAFGSLVHYFVEHQNPTFIKIANVDYALIQKDIDDQGLSEKSEAFNESLKKYFKESPEYSFGNKLFLHPIKPEYSSPLMYIPSNITTIGGIGTLASMLAQDSYDLDSALFLKSQNREKMYLLNEDIEQYRQVPHSGKIAFHRINPTKYTITLTGVQGITPVIFNQNYHPDWKIYFDNRERSTYMRLVQYFSPPKSNPDHFIVNGYANAWFINPNTICTQITTCVRDEDGSYTISAVIEYWPNRLFILGLVLFCFTCISMVIWLFISVIRRTL